MTISTVSWNRCKWGLGWKPCQIWSWWTWHRSARFRLGNPSSSSSSAIPVSLLPLSSEAAKTETLDRRSASKLRMAFHSLFPSRSFGRGGMNKWRLLCKGRWWGIPKFWPKEGKWGGFVLTQGREVKHPYDLSDVICPRLPKVTRSSRSPLPTRVSIEADGNVIIFQSIWWSPLSLSLPLQQDFNFVCYWITGEKPTLNLASILEK